jgi:hypothetical protein
VHPVPLEISGFLSSVLDCCLDIRGIWLMGQDDKAGAAVARWQLLAFADHATLQRLRKAHDLHRPDIEVLVVTDGERCENAWGECHLAGSLVRWGWREVSEGEAFYNESRWGDNNDGAVVRVRRKALVVWQSTDVTLA